MKPVNSSMLPVSARSASSATTPLSGMGTSLPSKLLLALVAAAALSACQRTDDTRTAGQQIDAAVAKTENKADELKADAAQAGKKAEEAVSNAADSVSSKTRDVAITAEITAKLARDKDLSAVRIDADTDAGRVVLRGSAPDAASRERAATLAREVTGVVSVSNDLIVAKP